MKKFKALNEFVLSRENRRVKLGEVVELNQKEEKALRASGCIDKAQDEKEDPPKKTTDLKAEAEDQKETKE